MHYKKGKKVITANKALVSKHWNEINKICKKHNSFIHFEAAVAGDSSDKDNQRIFIIK